MRLTELEPQFLVIEEPQKRHRYVDDIVGADGVMFLCPKCFRANGGSVGTHWVLCWALHVPLTESPGPGRWELVGTGYGDLSLRAVQSSVELTSGCRWHGFVTNGEVTGA